MTCCVELFLFGLGLDFYLFCFSWVCLGNFVGVSVLTFLGGFVWVVLLVCGCVVG